MGQTMSAKSRFLLARPSFLEGMARVVDLGGTLQIYNGSITPKEADARALVADWLAVGEDIHAAMSEYAEQK